MRHLFLTTEFPPEVGGIERYLEGLARALAQRGERVTVVACGVDPGGKRDAPYELRHLDAVDRHLGQRPGDGFVLGRLVNSAVCALRRRAQGQRTAASVLERHADEELRIYVGAWNETAHGWCRHFRRVGVPYRMFAYGRELVRSLDPVRRRWRSGDFGGAERVYACSAATASLVERRFEGADARSVLPGVSGPDAPEEVEAGAERLMRELEIGDDERVLVTVGRLVRRKGVSLVLRALASGSFACQVRYVVAGSGPREAELRRMSRELGVAEHVAFLGRVDELTKWAVYHAGDVFVMPSRSLEGSDWEGFGIVLLEAAVMGMPAVAGRAGGTAEAVVNGETGYLVEPEDPSELEEALRRLLEHPEQSEAFGRRARNRALRDFTWEAAAGRLLADL